MVPKNKDLFNLDETIAKELFEQFDYPYEVVGNIRHFILKLMQKLDKTKYRINGDVAIAIDAKVSDKAEIEGPTIIDSGAEIRPFSYIRGNVIVGKNAVVGNSTEIKNAILFNDTQTPHFNYVGDSILGFRSHIGAGVILSNVKSDKSEIVLTVDGEIINTKMKKLGAILADHVEVGCNSVLNPGTIVGKDTNIYPLSRVRGYLGENKIYKGKDSIVEKEKY